MELVEAIKILKRHQTWRKGANIEMVHPAVLSAALECAIAELDVPLKDHIKREIVSRVTNHLREKIPNAPSCLRAMVRDALLPELEKLVVRKK